MAVIRLLKELRTRVPSAHVALETFDHGGTAVDVTVGSRSFELFCGPMSGNGVSETHDDTLPFTAHDRYFDTPDLAVSHFLSLVEKAAQNAAQQAA